MSYRSVVIGIILSLIAVWWMHQASLVQAPGLLYAPVYLLSVPPVPAVFCLILLVALVPLTTRLFRGALGKKEMIFIYMVLVIAIPPVTFGVTESMLPAPTAANYFAAPDNNFAAFAEAMPQWFYPHDDEVIRAMYEGSDDGSVPWGPWAYPLTMWILFIGLLFFTGTCLLTLFRKQWVENERLRFPLLFIPMSIVEKEAPGSHVAFFRHPLVWIGVVIVVIHHALNIAHAYNPAVMALQDRFYLGRGIFTEYPWTVYRGVTFFHRPQVIGLAYFVPLDILFSGWFFFLLQPTLRLFSELFGISATPGFPHTLAQSAGGYLGMIFVLFWVGRRELGVIFRKALTGDPSIDDSREPLSHRAAVLGTVGGFIAIVAWVTSMGAYFIYAAAYFFMFIGFGLVYSRLRAEAGLPTMWGYFGGHTTVLKYFVGSDKLMRGGDLTNMSVLTTFDWLTDGYFLGQMGYVIENERLAEDVKLKPRVIVPVMIVVFVLACAYAVYLNLGDYYEVGALVLHGGTTRGGYNIQNAVGNWTQATMMMNTGSAADIPQAVAMIAGALLTILLVVARWRWLRVPFHPVGYIACIQYGYCLWGPFMATWIIKGLIHKLGGARLYRQLMPFFLGLAFGDLLSGGITWIVMAVFGHDITSGYMVQFG